MPVRSSQPRGRARRLRRVTAHLAAGLVLSVLAPACATAGLGGSVVPSFPTPENVGDIKTATITIKNNSTTPNNAENVIVSGIVFTPSCAASDGFTCTTPDPGVFQFASIVGKTGTSCQGVTFTAINADPGTGAIELSPTKPFVLGPADGSGTPPYFSRTCVIQLNYQVLRAPVDSTPPVPPLTTDGLAHGTLLGATTGNAGAAAGVSTATITAPEVTITKSPKGLKIDAGELASFSIVIDNSAGTGDATSVQLNDPLPNVAGLDWQLAPPVSGCAVSGSNPQVLGCTALQVPAGQATTLTVSARTTAQACTVMTNTATITALNTFALQSPLSDNGSITCGVPQVDLVITKNDGKTAVLAHGTTAYTVTVSNSGPSEVTGAVVTDPASAGLALGSWSCAVSAPGSGGTVTTACGAASGSGPLSTTANLKVGGSVTYTIAATVTATTGSVSNAASVAPPAGTTNTGTGCTAGTPGNPRSFNAGVCTAGDIDTVTPVADLVITRNGHADPAPRPGAWGWQRVATAPR
jgi:uncharacterized repeat protein (TIGR01451 family)